MTINTNPLGHSYLDPAELPGMLKSMEGYLRVRNLGRSGAHDF